MSFEIKRKIDKLGRIVLPKDIRRAYGIEVGAQLCFRIVGDRIFVVKERENDEKARAVDKLGRIVLPSAHRRALGIKAEDELLLIPKKEGLYIVAAK